MNQRRSLAPRPQVTEGSSSSKSAEVIGRLTVNTRGFGFVLPEDGSEDVFIPARGLGGGMHGDRVKVRVHQVQRGREGHVSEIIERNLKRLTGVLVKKGRVVLIEPTDTRIRGPVPVIDPPKQIQAGVMVVCEVVDYPRHIDEPPTVRVIDVLGTPGVADVEVRAIKLREGVEEEFPPAVMEEAALFPERLGPWDMEAREDLRGVGLVTIDPEDARDHDDALWAERLDNGDTRVLIAIADVAHYVQPGTAIDQTALARGCSIYLPDRAIPMLPAALSSHLASLVPDEDRLTLAVEVVLSPQGAIRKRRFIEGVMRSHARLTYGGLARAMGWTREVPSEPQAESRKPMLEVLSEAAEVLRKRRMKRGAMDFDLPEARVKLDPSSLEPIDVIRSRKDPGLRRAYNVVEEMMLLANEVVAKAFAQKKIPAIYRIHGAPDPKKIEVFAEAAARLGFEIDPDAFVKPHLLSAFLKRLSKTPHAPILGTLLLRSMQQATYDPNNIGHFGLAAPFYVHFTSPIRRYPDLIIHRILRLIIRNKKENVLQAESVLPRVAREASRLERRAMVVEREVVDLYRALLMRDRVGETFDGSITGVNGNGFYCALDAPFVEVFCPLQGLGNDAFRLSDDGLALVGAKNGKRFALGDRIRVKVQDVSINRRQVTAIPAFVENIGTGTQAKPSEKPEQKSESRTSKRFGRRGSGNKVQSSRSDAKPVKSSHSTSKKPKRR